MRIESITMLAALALCITSIYRIWDRSKKNPCPMNTTAVHVTTNRVTVLNAKLGNQRDRSYDNDLIAEGDYLHRIISYT